MYLPSHFTETRPAELQRLLREHPLGALIINGPHGLDANHVPFDYDPQGGTLGRLSAHVARANPLWQEVSSGSEVLVIFRPEGCGSLMTTWAGGRSGSQLTCTTISSPLASTSTSRSKAPK